jgi:hypothetical protein
MLTMIPWEFRLGEHVEVPLAAKSKPGRFSANDHRDSTILKNSRRGTTISSRFPPDATPVLKGALECQVSCYIS